MSSEAGALERWDLYPFAERAPSRIWDQVTRHAAWVAPIAWLAPQSLKPWRPGEEFHSSNIVSTARGFRRSATEIEIAAYLLARILDRPDGTVLRVQRCLTYHEDREPLYRQTRWQLVGLAMARGFKRIEWEVLEPSDTLAQPATFDLIGPCNDPGIANLLGEWGFEKTGEWAYLEGPIEWSGQARFLREDDLAGAERVWREYSEEHLAQLLPHPIPPLAASMLSRFVPSGMDATLFLPRGGGGPVGQLCPDLGKSAARKRGRGRRVEDAEVVRVLRCLSPDAEIAEFCRVPEDLRGSIPSARTVQVGPIPRPAAAQNGMKEIATLRIYTLRV